jgi:hypothetical protein
MQDYPNKIIPGYGLYLALLSFLALSSCSMEWKLARNFTRPETKTSVLLLPPDYIFKTSLKKDSIPNASSLAKDQLDSALFVNSKFIQYLSDSILLEGYVNSLIDELYQFGITVLLNDQVEDFMASGGSAYTVNLAQLEAEEYIRGYRDDEDIGELTYYKDFALEAVNLNSWFEITRLNPKREGYKVLFDQGSVSDEVEGYFTENMFTGEVRYTYSETKMALEDIYELAVELGRRHASMLYDYLLNDHISSNLPAGTRRANYLHYQRKGRYFRPAYDFEKFTEVR